MYGALYCIFIKTKEKLPLDWSYYYKLLDAKDSARYKNFYLKYNNPI